MGQRRDSQLNTYVGIVEQMIIVAVLRSWLGGESHPGHLLFLLMGVVLVDNCLHL